MMKAILLTIVCASACRDKEVAERQMLAVRALDDGGALVIWREHSLKHSIARLGTDARVQWSATLEGDAALFFRPDDGLVIGNGRVSVRTHRGDDAGLYLQVESFSLLDGSRWTARLGVVPDEGDLPRMPGYVVGGQLYEASVAFETDVRRDSLVTFDLGTGAEIRRVPLPFEPRRSVIGANDVLLRGAASDALVSASGDVRVLERGDGCVLEDRYWRLLQSAPERYTLATADQPTSLSLDLGPGVVTLEHCARYREHFVLLLGRKPPDQRYRRELWVVRQDGSVIGNVVDATLPSQMAATLPRFVPILRESPVAELVMIDLQEGRVAWQRPVEASVILGDPFRSGDRWYITNKSAQPELAVFDGTTGRVIAVRRLEAKHGIEPPKPNNVSEKGLWLHRGGWQRGSTLVSVLDPVTLALRAGSPVQVVGVSPKSVFSSLPGN